MAFFLAVEITIETRSREPARRYARLLAETYLEAEDWEQIHFLEARINISDLDSDFRELFFAKFWENYIEAPEEYARINNDHADDLLKVLFDRQKGDLLDIFRNRSDYLLPEATSLIYQGFGDGFQLIQLELLLDEIEDEIIVSKEALNSGDVLGAVTTLQNFRLRVDAFAVGLDPPLLVSQKYELVVYDCLRHLPPSDLLTDLAKEALFDQNEDPLLRYLSANYLLGRLEGTGRVGSEFLNEFFGLLEGSTVPDTLTQSSEYERNAELLLQQELILILRQMVQEEIDDELP